MRPAKEGAFARRQKAVTSYRIPKQSARLILECGNLLRFDGCQASMAEPNTLATRGALPRYG